jgi:hypothetical protein
MLLYAPVVERKPPVLFGTDFLKPLTSVRAIGF